MNRRNGVTLTEVLIAIFVLSIGLMALLSLFPLGAAQMAQALKDQRTAEAAAIAGAQGRIIWKEACEIAPNARGLDPQFFDTSTTPPTPTSFQRFAYALDLPNLNNLNGGPSRPYALPRAAVPNRPAVDPSLPDMVRIPDQGDRVRSSYPVFVDPIGWEANYKASTTARMLWVGYPMVGVTPGTPLAQPNGKRGLIPRRPLYVSNPDPTSPAKWVALGSTDPNTPPALTKTQRILSRFSLLDDMTFDANGLPSKPNGMIERQGRYTWAFLFRRQNNKQKNRSNVEMTVVVYSGRSIDVPGSEEHFLTDPLNDLRNVTIDYSGRTKPAVRRGSWILDATIFSDSGEVDPQAYFYRVTNVDDSVANKVTLDLQTPLNGSASRRIIIVMENVVEVFPKGIVTATSPPGDYRAD